MSSYMFTLISWSWTVFSSVAIESGFSFPFKVASATGPGGRRGQSKPVEAAVGVKGSAVGAGYGAGGCCCNRSTGKEDSNMLMNLCRVSSERRLATGA